MKSVENLLDVNDLLGKKSYIPIDGGDCVYGFVFEAFLETHGVLLPDWLVRQRAVLSLSNPNNVHVEANSLRDSVRQAYQVAKHLVATVYISRTFPKRTPCYVFLPFVELWGRLEMAVNSDVKFAAAETAAVSPGSRIVAIDMTAA